MPRLAAPVVLSRSTEGRSRLSEVRLSGGARSHAQLGEIQRARLLAGVVLTVGELGYEGATVGKITARARVSRRTFYELFANSDECLVAVLEDVAGCLSGELEAAGVGGLVWCERLRRGLEVILGFLDREPMLARVCVVEALRAGPAVQDCRERILAQLAAVVDEGRTQGARGQACGAVTAEGLVGAALAIVHARIAHPDRWALDGRRGSLELAGLLGELMGIIVLPYLGPAAARRERVRGPGPSQAVRQARSSAAPVSILAPGVEDPLQGVSMRLTYRTARVLEGVHALSKEDGQPSNRQVAAFAGIADPGQVSKLLRRLERLGLLENRSPGHAQGEPNEWRLTTKGALVVDGIRLHTPNAGEAA